MIVVVVDGVAKVLGLGDVPKRADVGVLGLRADLLYLVVGDVSRPEILGLA